jgi:hypothetical protein
MKDARVTPSTPSVVDALAVVQEVRTAQDLRAVRPGMVDVVHGTIDVTTGVDVSNFLVHLHSPCTLLREGCAVTFRVGGEATVKEIVDSQNFTVDRSLVDGEDTLIGVGVRDFHVVREDVLMDLCLSAIREVSERILDESVLNKIDGRMSTIEKFFGSALARLRKLENM